MAGSADFITTSKTQKHELIRGIYGLLLLRGGGVELAFGGHVRGKWIVVVGSGYNDGVLVIRRSALLTRSAFVRVMSDLFYPILFKASQNQRMDGARRLFSRGI